MIALPFGSPGSKGRSAEKSRKTLAMPPGMGNDVASKKQSQFSTISVELLTKHTYKRSEGSTMKAMQTAMAVLIAGTITSQATLIAYWDFNGLTTPYSSVSSVSGDQSPVAMDVSNIPSDARQVWSPGTTLNAVGSTPAGDAIQIYRVDPTYDPNGTYFQIQLSMSGFTDLEVSYAQRSATLDDAYISWSYSTDNSIYTSWGTANTSPGSTWEQVSYATAALDGVATVYLRGTVMGVDDKSFVRLDNLQLNATPVPEPVNVAMGLFGLGLVGTAAGRRYMAKRAKKA